MFDLILVLDFSPESWIQAWFSRLPKLTICPKVLMQSVMWWQAEGIAMAYASNVTRRVVERIIGTVWDEDWFEQSFVAPGQSSARIVNRRLP